MPLEYRTLHVSFDKETERGGDVDQDESFYPQAYVVSFVDLQSFGSTTISSEANVSVSLPPMHITTASKAIAVNESLNVIAEVSARMGEVSLHSISIPGVEFVTRYEQTIQSDPLADSECSNRLLISTRKIKSESCLSSLTLSGNLSSVNAALSDLLYKADIGMSSAAFGLERIEIRLLSLENFLERERAGIVTAGSLSSSRTFRFSVNIVSPFPSIFVVVDVNDVNCITPRLNASINIGAFNRGIPSLLSRESYADNIPLLLPEMSLLPDPSLLETSVASDEDMV
jgi:hypothetical protein